MNSFEGTHPPSTVPRKTRRRRRRGGGAPSTPLQYWTSYNNNNKHRHFSSDAGAGDEAKFSGGTHVVELSARKLAAGVWRLRSLRYGIGGFRARRRSSYRSRLGPGIPRLNIMLSRNQSSEEHRSGSNHQLWRSRSTEFGPKQGILHKNSKSLKDGAIKRDSRCSKASIEADCLARHVKFLEEQVKSMSLVSALQAELMQAQLYIHDLEHEVLSSKNRVKYLVRKLGEERTSRKKKEHDKIHALIDDLKGRLSRERKRQQEMDVLNSQLVKELTESKLSAIQSDRKYEEEKRTRKLLEEVCHELVKKIEEDKAEVEEMRIETMKIREEIEEERSMLQVAEIWREERVRMKLIDAKLALECKYSQLNNLITVLETFLSSRSTSLDLTELRKVELIARAVKAVSVQDTEEISGKVFAIFKELEVCEREIEPWFNYSLTVDISDYHPVSPQENYHDTKGREGVDRVENQGSIEESGRSIISIGALRSGLRCEIKQDKTASRVSSNSETNEVCSISEGLSKLKKSSSSKLRTTCVSTSGSYKAITDEGNGGLSSRMVSSLGTYLPMGHYGSTDSVNSNVPRGMKGCIEWPKGKARTEGKRS